MLNDAFKALSDPTRRRILELLTEGDLTAGEIAGCFDISKPSVSHPEVLGTGAGRAQRPEHRLQPEYDCFPGTYEMVF